MPSTPSQAPSGAACAVQLGQRRRLARRVRLPAALPPTTTSPGAKRGIGARHHLAHDLAGHHPADLPPARHRTAGRTAARACTGRSTADGAGQHLALAGLGNRVLDEREILRARLAGGPAAQHHRTRALHSVITPPPPCSTSRPVTPPSRRRISASLAWRCGTVVTGTRLQPAALREGDQFAQLLRIADIAALDGQRAHRHQRQRHAQVRRRTARPAPACRPCAARRRRAARWRCR